MTRGILVCATILATAGGAFAQGMDREEAERQGIDLPSASVVELGREASVDGDGAGTGRLVRERSAGFVAGLDVLLIPDSTNDRVMAFDPATGDLVDADFIPADPTNLSTPIHAILATDGSSILVSDQIQDVVQRYDLDGNHLGVFAPAGGADTSILDNVRGIALRPNGNLLVTVGGGANDDAVAQFDTGGNDLANFVANGAGGLDSPFDVSQVAATAGSVTAGEYVVGGITSDLVHRYDASGGALASLAPINTFPEQVRQIANGNFLVANFSGTQEGVVELGPDGTLIGVYDPAALGGYRGVYELPNGNILTTNGSGVFEIDRSGNVVDTKISGVSARFIERVTIAPLDRTIDVPVGGPLALVLLGLGLLAVALRTLRSSI